jgi:outer membrane immunogenic protein
MKGSSTIKLLAAILLSAASLAHAQASGSAPFGLENGQAPPLQVGLQFQATHANAPPGQCGCFWMEGGGLQVVRSFWPNLSVVGDIYYGANGAINNTDEQISIFNYVFGPRYNYRTSTRYTPYGQVLGGASHVSSNYYAYKSGETALALQAGLGVETNLKRHYSVPVEADWVYSRALNGVNTHQNNLRIGFGIIYRFGPG